MDEAGGSKAPDAVVATLAAAKRSSEKTFGQIAAETGLTNVYVAQLFRRQAQLKPDAVTALRSSVPALTDDLVSEMMSPPFRSFRPDLIQEPTIYRLNEAVMHFGESIKEIINEDFGDGIMSAIDFYCSVDKVKGVDGKDRVVITFDGKYLPYSEQTKELGCQPTPSKLHARTHKHAADSSWVDRRAHYTGDNFDRECTASSQATSEGANVRMPSVQSSFELSKKTADAKKKGRVDGLGATTAAFEQGSSSSYSGPPANMISSEQLEIIKAELKAELKAKMKDDIKAIMATQFVRLEKLEKKLRKKFKSDVKRKRKGRMEEEEDSDDIESD